MLGWVHALVVCFAISTYAAPSFKISADGTSFLKDGEPFRIVSGSVHYFRIHPALFQDRLHKARLGGLNAVQTYVPWNFHNTEQEVYNLTLLQSFLDIAKSEGLLVTIRPGPYACAEWEFGGFPYWLLQQFPTITLRSSDPLFLSAVSSWWSVLLPFLKPYLYSNGGNVVLMQVENEYGSYGTDKVYLNYLRDLLDKYLGEDSVILHSTDGNGDAYLLNTYIPGVFQTVDFGPGQDAANAFSMQHNYSKAGPYMNSEYYTGWLTHWGDKQMAAVNTSEVAKYLQSILSFKNASVNMYMYHGGTNFGFWNGANGDSASYQPTITSYDYDGPLTEAGDPTVKYALLRNVISQFIPVPLGPLPVPSKKGDYGAIALTEQVSLFASGVLEPPFTTPITTSSTYSFERLGIGYGFVLYRTNLTREANQQSTLHFSPRDRAWVYLNGKYIGLVYRNANNSIALPATSTTSQLDILVENMGRINYGPALTDFKGLGPVGVINDFFYVFNWIAYPLPLTSPLSKLPFAKRYSGAGASFFRGTFNVDGAPLDTYFNMTGWTKGNVFINGFNLGRYWSQGPQLSLYVPAPVLLSGENEVIIFETEGTSSQSIIAQMQPNNR